MASNAEDDSKPPRSNQSPPLSQQHPQPHQGYPPPPPYQGYGPPGGPGSYPYYPPPNNYPYNVGAPSQPPPPPYYNSAPPPPYMPINPERSHGYTFARLLFVIMIFLFIGTSLMSLITWLVFGSDIPAFHVESLNMPVVNITNSTVLTAKWDANVTVKNPNKKLEIHFENIETNLLYKDYLLDTSFVEPFQLAVSENKTFLPTFETRDYSKNVAAALLVKEMGEEGGNAVVVFDMAISTTAAYRSESAWKKKVSLRILCVDLEVVFPKGISGGGAWRGDNLKDCYVWT